MERIGKTGMWVWLLLLAVSCTRTEVEEKDLPPHPAKEVEAVFNLNVLANRPLQTRSITFTPEGTFEIDSIAPPIHFACDRNDGEPEAERERRSHAPCLVCCQLRRFG